MTNPSRVLDPHRSPLETPMLLVGVRCTVRYVALPVVLPLLGVATGAALGVVLVLDGLAVISIVAAVRRLWCLRHPRRWQYLPVAVTLIAVVVVMAVSDARALNA
jgi:hypothetical protein